MRDGHRDGGAKEVMSTALGISLIADLCLLFQNTTYRRSAEMERAGSTDPALKSSFTFYFPFYRPMKSLYSCSAFSFVNRHSILTHHLE